MTDAERALALMDRWFKHRDPGNLVDWVADEFDQVRLEEQRRLVAYLRQQAFEMRWPSALAALEATAAAIERGEAAS